jgi:hypothetical protein
MSYLWPFLFHKCWCCNYRENSWNRCRSYWFPLVSRFFLDAPSLTFPFFTNADVVTIKDETSKENSWNRCRSYWLPLVSRFFFWCLIFEFFFFINADVVTIKWRYNQGVRYPIDLKFCTGMGEGDYEENDNAIILISFFFWFFFFFSNFLSCFFIIFFFSLWLWLRDRFIMPIWWWQG